MKVLFYVEPHFIRNNKNAFNHVANQFLPLLRTNKADEYTAKLFANLHVISSLDPTIRNDLLDKIIAPTDDEEKIFSSSFDSDEDTATEIFLDLVNGRGISQQYERLLNRIHLLFPFDVIIYWGENGAVKKFSKERDLTSIGIELGCTRKPFDESLVLDVYGTNGSTLIPKLTINQIGKAVNHKKMSQFNAIFANGTEIASRIYSNSFNAIDHPLLHSILTHKKTVFLPLQLYDDVNLIHFSQYKRLKDVVLDIIPKLASKNYITIVKTHPSSAQRKNGLLENLIAKKSLQKWSDKVIWIDDDPNSSLNIQLIKHTNFTVTVNSSLGFEATLFDKPVVVLGDAVYKPKNLFPSLEGILNGEFNHLDYIKNLGYLREFMLGAYLQHQSLIKSKSEFMRVIKLFVYAKNISHNDPEKIASLVYKHLRPWRSIGVDYPSIENIAYGKSVNKISPTLISEKEENEKVLKNGFCKLLSHRNFNNFQEFQDWLLDKINTNHGFCEIIALSEIVDRDYYLKTYSDIDTNSIDPIIHYSNHGIDEKRSPQESFLVSSKNELVQGFLTIAKNAFFGLK